MKILVIATACFALLPSMGRPQGRAVDFDLVCTAKADDGTIEAPQRTFHVQISDDDQVAMMERGVPTPSKEETHTYVNAYLWRADGVDHHFDRFTGKLTTKPKSFTWHCTKVGGQKF